MWKKRVGTEKKATNQKNDSYGTTEELGNKKDDVIFISAALIYKGSTILSTEQGDLDVYNSSVWKGF